VDPEVSDYAAAIATRPELVELINSDDLVTVFVPTNRALDDVQNWEQIVADEAAFDSFVRSHLITGALTAEQIFAGTQPRQLPTLSGEMVTVDPVARTINGVRIVTADTPATNGVVHTIDGLFVVPTVAPTTVPATTVAGTTTIG
jgi:uncharacterized surface protein with fasciclin (FAS1) repeats